MIKSSSNDVVEIKRDLDLSFIATKAENSLCSRPMSNNVQIDWGGDNWFFRDGDTRKVRQAEADRR